MNKNEMTLLLIILFEQCLIEKSMHDKGQGESVELYFIEVISQKNVLF